MHYITTIGGSEAMQMIHYILTFIIINIINIIIIINYMYNVINNSDDTQYTSKQKTEMDKATV